MMILFRKTRLNMVMKKIAWAETFIARYNKYLEEYNEGSLSDVFYRTRDAKEELLKQLEELMWKKMHLVKTKRK